MNSTMRIILTVFFLFINFSIFSERVYAGDTNKLIKFEIKLVKGAADYVHLLQYPSYLAIALENSGTRGTNAGRVVIVDRHNLKFRNVSVKFLEKKGYLFKFICHVQWDLSMTQLTLDIPFDIDVSHLNYDNIAEVKFYPTGSALLPDALIQKMQMKIQSIASEQAQNGMVIYLQKIQAKNKDNIEGFLESILIDSYNLPVVSTGDGRKEFGDAEPLKDQYYLLATILIWFLLLPTTIGFLWWKKQRKLRG